MIKTSKQLKDLIHNRTKGESGKSQLLFRNYAMERFLERIALSPYNNNFILKGGLLISSIVGLDNRATMDIDATIRNLPIESEHMRRIIEEIMAVEIDDNMCFEIKDVSGIMDDAEYGGIRFSLDAYLDKTRIPLKIVIQNFWECYQSKNSYAAGITWSELMSCIRSICDKCVSHYRGITD